MSTTLLSAVFRKLEMATEELEAACRRWGLKSNVAKCKILSKEGRRLFTDNTHMEEVDKFVFLMT